MSRQRSPYVSTCKAYRKFQPRLDSTLPIDFLTSQLNLLLFQVQYNIDVQIAWMSQGHTVDVIQSLCSEPEGIPKTRSCHIQQTTASSIHNFDKFRILNEEEVKRMILRVNNLMQRYSEGDLLLSLTVQSYSLKEKRTSQASLYFALFCYNPTEETSK